MKQTIRFEYEAQYHLSQEPTFDEEEIWLVLHGYGQLAEFFVRKFHPFFSPKRLFVAPEATNHHYRQGFQGRVGANWMTRHERETAIANNHRFLDALLGQILDKYPSKPTVHVLGFSQGAATATRWASRWQGKIATLVLWAGGFALDMSLECAKEAFAETQLILALGDRDELITPDQLQKQEDLISSLNKEILRYSFAGGHELDAELLEKIINQKK
ncbi:alpha/beta hydrolase [Algoriphagus sp. H41]|uniref:Alpha/beta hydrolase n=1 Tax=Algoriphagus oliviformis TaxID=2811231 RepID=A0ABS3BZ70_9BACT|nr:alpha/beta hydrolase [Algoriphagus oliviformis]MBN7810157.1 alpha/beta hydrolase [Algoriphagus oliviformis]